MDQKKKLNKRQIEEQIEFIVEGLENILSCDILLTDLAKRSLTEGMAFIRINEDGTAEVCYPYDMDDTKTI